MMEWPGRCSRCKKPIENWADAGFDDHHWVHKSCFIEAQREAQAKGQQVQLLRSPDERYHQLELPMLIFVLMFHFGIGLAVMGWIIIDQGGSQTWGAVLMALGVIFPAMGLAGATFNIVSRRRIEQVRQELLLAGGWKPGR
jgi:hypothetical protein